LIAPASDFGRIRGQLLRSPHDAVPVCDVVPAGVIDLVRAAGGDIVSPGDLIMLFYSRWSGDQLERHRRAVAALADNADATFRRLAADVAAGNVLLLDLWCKENDDAVWADQTWMACLAPQVPERAAHLFAIITGARDAAVRYLRSEINVYIGADGPEVTPARIRDAIATHI